MGIDPCGAAVTRKPANHGGDFAPPTGLRRHSEGATGWKVVFTSELRQAVSNATSEMHQYSRRVYTPKATPSKSSNACSLKNLCPPRLQRLKTVSKYLDQYVEEDP